jgi:hypothetical protein
LFQETEVNNEEVSVESNIGDDDAPYVVPVHELSPLLPEDDWVGDEVHDPYSCVDGESCLGSDETPFPPWNVGTFMHSLGCEEGKESKVESPVFKIAKEDLVVEGAVAKPEQEIR